MKKLIAVICLIVPLVVIGTRMSIGEDPGSSLHREFLDNQSERHRQALVLGENHPIVKTLDAKIALLKKELQKEKAEQLKTPTTVNVEGMSDAELRKLIGVLVDRIAIIEDEVNKFKERRPQVELLGQ